MSKKGLGKGLSALIPTQEYLNTDEPVCEIEINKIQPNSFQPRRVFDEKKLCELAESIKEHGVVQPVVVRALGIENYELVVGERRLRACQMLELKKIPAIVKNLSNSQMMEIALVENIQRQDLNPVEEAMAYKRLVEEFNLTQEQVAQKVSKSRSLIANMIRLLNLPQQILEKLSLGQLTIGHVRPILSVDNVESQLGIANEIYENKLSVRETESLIKEKLNKKEKETDVDIIEEKKESKNSIDKKLSPNMLDIESKLRSKCGTKVKIKDMGNKGKIEIDYYNSDDLDRIVSIFINEDVI